LEISRENRCWWDGGELVNRDRGKEGETFILGVRAGGRKCADKFKSESAPCLVPGGSERSTDSLHEQFPTGGCKYS